MPIEDHLMDDEVVEEYCYTPEWAWVATNDRVIKYRDSGASITDLHDLSYEEISAISLTTEEKDNTLIYAGVGLTLAGLVLTGVNYLIAIVAFLLGVGMLYYWYDMDESSHFEFRGGGLIEQEPDQWRIEAEANSDDAREFVKTVRSQL